MAMEKPPRRAYTAEQLRERRRLRHESRTGSTYKQFLKDLEREGNLPEEIAEKAAASVLCALEQRLISDEAKQLEAQLPQRLQELLHRCERHEELLPRDIGREEFLQMVGEDLNLAVDRAEAITRAVLKVVSARVTEGEIHDVLSQLPAELRALFPAEILQRLPEARPGRPGAPGRAAEPRVSPERRGIVVDIVNDLLQLPFEAQLGVLRTIAPKIIHQLDKNTREGFLRDLNEEIERADRGEEPYDIRPIDERH